MSSGVGSQPDSEPPARKFPIGSREPGTEVKAVQSDQNHVIFRRAGERWFATEESGGDKRFYWWHQMNSETSTEGGMPLTEVVVDQPGGGRDV